MQALTPSKPAAQGFRLRSSVSRQELYLRDSAIEANPAESSLFSLRFRTFKVRFRLSTCARNVMPLRKSLPLRSSVRRAPRRGNESKARTLSNSAALGPEWAGIGFCRAVIPPWLDEARMGTGWPEALSGFTWGDTAAPLFDLGTYGVYVVCIVEGGGCRGGGNMGPTTGTGVEGGDKGNDRTEDDGDEDAEFKETLPVVVGDGDGDIGTTSG